MTITITLNQEQAQIVLACLDIAVKQAGLQAAPKILPIAEIIASALKSVEAPKP